MTTPTIFHITHHKAGSQWVAEILKYCALERVQLPKINTSHFFQEPIQLGKVYLTVYVTKSQFDAVIANTFNLLTLRYGLKYTDNLWTNFQNFQKNKYPYLKLVVIRDLRDTLISSYFSNIASHPILRKQQIKKRSILSSCDLESGLIAILKNPIFKFKKKAAIQSSWFNDSDSFLIRYEDIVANEFRAFEEIINYCQINVSQQHIYEVVKHNTFEAVTGRKRGEEDINSHQRKGTVGDWKNHFSDRVKNEFKKQFGAILIKTGYENDLNW